VDLKVDKLSNEGLGTKTSADTKKNASNKLGFFWVILVCSIIKWLRWSGLWYPSTRIYNRRKPSNIKGKKKILSMPFFGGEVRPSVLCPNLTACKRSLNVTWKSAFRQKLPDISRPQFHLPPLGALAWWHAWRRLVAKVGMCNPDRTVSLEGCSA
jgi:hypothetical protein